MKADDWILLSFPAANRDPAVFEDADQVIIDREVNRHAAFGLGIHRCIGSHLARMELRVRSRPGSHASRCSPCPMGPGLVVRRPGARPALAAAAGAWLTLSCARRTRTGTGWPSCSGWLRVTAGLTAEELDQRLEQALTARTVGELAELSRDLPAASVVTLAILVKI